MGLKGCARTSETEEIDRSFLSLFGKGAFLSLKRGKRGKGPRKGICWTAQN